MLNYGSQNVNPEVEHVDLFVHFLGTERCETLGDTPCRFARTSDAEVHDSFIGTAAHRVKQGH
jgi:hypothetical protein